MIDFYKNKIIDYMRFLFLGFALFTHIQHIYAHQTKKIIITGNQRVQEKTILYYIKNAQNINEIVKQLYETGFFENVKVNNLKNQITIHVTERSIVQNIIIKGNESIKTDDIEKELISKKNKLLSSKNLRADIAKLKSLYHRMGKYHVQIKTEIIQKDGVVDLIFHIVEEQISTIKDIRFSGNDTFSPDDLERVLISKKEKILTFFNANNAFDSERFIYDQNLLKRFYEDQGFLDVHIEASSAYNVYERGFHLNFNINEGKRYLLKNIKIVTEIADININDLTSFLNAQKNEIYDGTQIKKDITEIEEFLSSKGYCFFSILQNNSRKNGAVDVVIKIQKEKPSYINRILIKNNHYTYDYVIRKNLPLHEGDPFNALKFQQIEDDLYGLGYFKSVKTEYEKDEEISNLIIDVEEQPTGDITFGGGYGMLDGPFASAKYIDKNFKGTGSELYGNIMWARKSTDISVGFSYPYFLNKNIITSMEIFHTTSNRFDEMKFKQYGFQIGLGYNLSKNWIQKFLYEFSHDKTTVNKEELSEILKKESGKYINSSLTHTITYDQIKRSMLSPKKGYSISLSSTYTGLGGNIYSFKNELNAKIVIPFTENITLLIQPVYGHIKKIKKYLRRTDRFNLGLNSFRGFEYAGIGPRYIKIHDAKHKSNHSVGGTQYAVVSSDLEFPIGLPKAAGIKGTVFSDIGTVWNSALHHKNVREHKKIRISGGIGLKWDSPMGPLKFEYAWALKKMKKDEERRFLFGYSTKI